MASVGAVLVAVGPAEKRLNVGAALVVVVAGVKENVGAVVVGFGRLKPNEVPALLVAVPPENDAIDSFVRSFDFLYQN